MKYRPEIDGLRAIAVLSVFLYHLGIKPFSGGFVGVDIFFVISGYLITGILQKDLDKNSFSIVKFYDRRIRRIFPALYLLLLVTFVVAYLLFMTNPMQMFCKSLMSSLLFYSNFYFWSGSGYFDLGSEVKPLLHTWSLSIEEQFYILYPTTLYLAHTYFNKYKKAGIAALFLVSLVGCILLTEKSAGAAFYFSPVRAWELLLGAMLALDTFPKFKQRAINETAAFLGLVLILYSVFRFSSKTSFPGYHALIPCFGTALLIHFTGNKTYQTIMDRFLATRLMTGIGKISYSLYLWHWPAIVFTKYFIPHKYDYMDQIIIVVLVFICSYLSWKYVEQPFRTKEGRFKKLKDVLVPVGAVTAVLLIASVLGGFISDGFPGRLSPTVQQYAKGAKDVNPDRKNCHSMPLERVKSNDLCVMGTKKSGSPDFIVWGDSFADAMMPGFKEMAEKKNLYGLFASSSACAPALGINRKVKGLQLKCDQFNDAMVEVIRSLKIRNVVLALGWAMSGYTLLDGSKEPPLKMEVQSTRYPERDVNIFYYGMNQTLEKIKQLGAKTWIVDLIPRPGFDVPDHLAMYERLGRDRKRLAIQRRIFDNQLTPIHEVLAELKKKYTFEIIDPNTILCPDHCIVENDGYPLYYDHQHLSSYAARMIEPTLDPFFESLRKN